MTQVFNRDCMEAMKEFPDKFFELAIVDPPYGIGAGKRRGDTGKNKHIKQKDYKYGDWDSKRPDLEYFHELRRVSVNQIIWGGNYFDLGPSQCYVVWNKKNGENLYADCELAWASFNSAVRMFEYRWFGFLQEKSGDEKEERIHPTQKPIALYKWLLKNYAKEGDKILDTHLGSGSSRIAADQMGFDFWGYELDKDYFEASVKRFNQYKAQTTLFSTEPKP
jgi:site-specific DNA-methyltransferase (adenine-specific)